MSGTKYPPQYDGNSITHSPLESEGVQISVVTPVYGHQLELKTLYDRLTESLTKLAENFEIIMVNDASPDNAWDVITELAQKDPRVRGVNLSRNFGQHAAITAGIEQSQGEWVVVMDCDLQDPPEEIEKLLGKAQQGFDIVFGKRLRRQDNLIKTLQSKLFFNVIRAGCGLEHEPGTANFAIFSKRVIQEAKADARTYLPFMQRLHDLGFQRAFATVAHSKRDTGRTGYSFFSRMSLAFDSIVSFSDRPLRMAVGFGFVIASLAILYALILVVQYLFFQKPAAGWTSVIVSIYLMGGIMLSFLGTLGIYIGKVFNAARRKPNFVVQEATFERE